MMAEMEIRPYEGFGPVDFGMTPTEVEDVIGPPESRFQRFPPLEEWLYQDSSLRIMFDSESQFEFVEFYEPTIAVVQEIRLTGSYAGLLQALDGRGYAVTQRGAVTICEALGVVVGRERPDRDDIYTAGAFRRGYWE